MLKINTEADDKTKTLKAQVINIFRKCIMNQPAKNTEQVAN